MLSTFLPLVAALSTLILVLSVVLFLIARLILMTICDSTRANHAIVAEHTRGEMAWMGEVIGPSDIDRIRPAAVRQLIGNQMWYEWQILV